MPSETAEEVIGRAPQVSGCGDDGIAVAWVQESSPGSGVEVVAGTVLQSSGGNSLLAINLTGLISNGILRGTEPTLLSDDNGDIVIGWVQSNSGGLVRSSRCGLSRVRDGRLDSAGRGDMCCERSIPNQENLDFGFRAATIQQYC